MGKSSSSFDNMFYMYFDNLFFLVIIRFGFDGGTLVLIDPVPGNCILVSFTIYINFRDLKRRRKEKRKPICLLSFTCNYVVSVCRCFLFLWVLRMGCVILLWHFLSLSYNYFSRPQCCIQSFKIIRLSVLGQMVFTIHGRGRHLGLVTWTIYINFLSPFP